MKFCQQSELLLLNNENFNHFQYKFLINFVMSLFLIA
jgi:hypothetical protein